MCKPTFVMLKFERIYLCIFLITELLWRKFTYENLTQVYHTDKSDG
jgi:hypothetical protein